ncbi:MAG: hypothetical protein V7765_21030 [Oleispira sp.]
MNQKAKFPVATNSDNTLVIPDNMVHDILYSPNDHQLIVLDKWSFKKLSEIEQPLQEKVTAFTKACNAGSRDSNELEQCQKDLREQLLQSAGIELNPDDPENKDISALVQGGKGFTEMVRFGTNKDAFAGYSFVPHIFIDEMKKRQANRDEPKRFYDLSEDMKVVASDTLTNEPQETSADKLRAWRFTEQDEAEDSNNKAGTINPQKVKDTFGKVKVEIKEEWGIFKAEKSGQIPTGYTRYLTGIGIFLSDDTYTMLDNWIAQVNKDCNVTANQYAKYRIEAVALLEKEDLSSKTEDVKKAFLPEDWDKAKSLVKDIWTEYSEIYIELANIYYSDVFEKEVRAKFVEKISNMRLPATQWDGSAGAQLMRYTMGASAKAELDILGKGKLAIGAEAGVELSLAEAKAEGSFYIPDSEGYALTPEVDVKREIPAHEIKGSTSELNRHSPYFAVDCSVLTPRGACEVLNTLLPWDVIKSQANVSKADPSVKPLFLQVVGHTSQTGSDNYNYQLGLRRSGVVADFVSNRLDQWLINFKNKKWNEPELEFMAYSIMIFNGLSTPAGFSWEQIGKSNEGTKLIDQLRTACPDLEQQIEEKGLGGRRLFPDRTDWFNENGKVSRKLKYVIEQYIQHIRARAESLIEDGIDLSSIELFSIPFISEGESGPQIDVPDEVFENRRCEFVAWQLDLDKTKIEWDKVPLNLGKLRARFQGHISAWAGANLQLGGQIAVAVPQGALALAPLINEYADARKIENDDARAGAKRQANAKALTKAQLEAEAVVEAYLGGKAAVGLKASLDWRKPKTKGDSSAPNFEPFGSAGYTVTGLAGIGGKGEFKIGFDDKSQRFVIKLKAEAALGLGIGGQFEFVVGIGHCFEFIKFVYEELERNNFSYIDIFDKLADGSEYEVFDLFSAYAWDLLRKGKFNTAAGVLGVGVVAEASVQILDSAAELLNGWNDSNIKTEQLNNLMESIQVKPALIHYLTPETKGRILFDLMNVRLGLDEIWPSDWDFNSKREETAKILIREGIKSRRDWQETLEHIGEGQGDAFKPGVKPNASVDVKTKRLKDNQQRLRDELLSDEDDWLYVEKHIASLNF